MATLHEIPNQPLFGGRKEDALIAYTFVPYLHTGDASWPLLFPMVKSVIKAMDVLQAFAPKGWGRSINKFIISGASKRGRTTWLTAATGDPRVVAIPPMAIDTLDIPAQMKHQLAVYGTYSKEIDDYVDAGLLKRAVVDSSAGRRLWRMVDPFSYRHHLTLSKLIVRGTNDPYWAQDALNLYWNGLRGGKWMLYMPNTRHDILMDERGEDHTLLLTSWVASPAISRPPRQCPDIPGNIPVKPAKSVSPSAPVNGPRLRAYGLPRARAWTSVRLLAVIGVVMTAVEGAAQFSITCQVRRARLVPWIFLIRGKTRGAAIRRNKAVSGCSTLQPGFLATGGGE